ncbi:MAG: hypothetical protein L3K17_10400 [Thermoplasmata archaeon]|nr:hypothetical protein [Thermoplasmata archaeon]
MPCHVLSCECSRFTGDSQVFLCPACAREYATRASLEIHLYGQHPGLSPRERSVLLQGALNGRTSPSAAATIARVVRVPAQEPAAT